MGFDQKRERILMRVAAARPESNEGLQYRSPGWCSRAGGRRFQGSVSADYGFLCPQIMDCLEWI